MTISAEYNIAYSIFLEEERQVMVQQEIGSSEKGSAVRNVLSKISAENVKQCFISDDLPVQFI